MNDDLKQRYEAALISGVHALVATLRENRFLWVAAALFFGLNVIATEVLWVRLGNVAGLALSIWHVVQTTRMIRDGRRLISDASQDDLSEVDQ